MESDDGKAGKWRLWRQDDNGNRFLGATFGDREAAERRLEALSRFPRKQTYWIEETPETLESLKQP